ncbi:MAG TPA: hypothetical protein VH351_05600 [Bryobacteraceae bacterium]|nr:hypothetical protein [Bryobacteraceae bacterium]
MKFAGSLLLLLIPGVLAARAQDSMPNMPPTQQMSMGGGMNQSGMLLMNESSGTSVQPQSWPMPMLMTDAGGWQLMWMAQAFVVDTQQSSPRGGDKLWSTNWGMLSALHNAGSGSLMLRMMLSLEPATISNRRYPLLFQTGETAYGVPIVDGQHPHNLFMEIGFQYAHPLTENMHWTLYYAPVGDPSLGPTAYPHRASASELPQAALGHHWEDSTHIAYNVVTAGISTSKLRLEASGFYGREPGENRWTLDLGPIDSWSVRLTLLPAKNWQAQVSTGRLTQPEALEAGDVLRTTASVEYVKPRLRQTSWATSLIWGQDQKLAVHRTLNAVTAETVVPVSARNFFTGRYEWSQRDELFDDDPANALAGRVFVVNAFTAGYTRDIPLLRNVETGLGCNVSFYAIDKTLQAYYGNHPWGANIFLRVRLRKQN